MYRFDENEVTIFMHFYLNLVGFKFVMVFFCGKLIKPSSHATSTQLVSQQRLAKKTHTNQKQKI